MAVTVPGTITSMGGTVKVVKQSIYHESLVALHRVGTRLMLSDGRVFYYAKNGIGALSAGYMSTIMTNVSGHRKMVVYAAAAIGVKKFTVTLGGTAATLNQYAEGFAHVSIGPGIGQAYKVKDHLAQLTATGNLVVNLYDPLVVALDTTSYITLTKNPWDGVVVYPATTATGPPVGVPLIAVTIGYYAWLQTWGPCALLCNTTMGIGQPVGLSGTAGSGLTHGADTTAEWGVVMNPNLTTEHSLVFLKCAP